MRVTNKHLESEHIQSSYGHYNVRLMHHVCTIYLLIINNIHVKARKSINFFPCGIEKLQVSGVVLKFNTF